MLFNIQVLRALAAFLVVFVHLDRLAELSGLPKGTTDFGNSGVDLFFVISGLIMVVTTTEKPQTVSHFLRHRFARIVPLYWAITLFVFALALTAPSLLQSTRADPVALVKSLAFIPFRRGDGAMHPIVFVGWTLNYEMIFYAVFALGMLVPRRLVGLSLTLGALAVAAALAPLVTLAHPVAWFYTRPVILEFGGGMVLGLLLTRDLLPRLRWSAVALGLAAFAAMLALPRTWPNVDRSVVSGIPAFFIVGSALMAERADLVIRNRWAQLLGAASYAVYLTHFFATQLVVKVADRVGHSPLFMTCLCAAALVFVACLGIAVHKSVELPLTVLARRMLGGKAPPLPATANIEQSSGTLQAEPTLGGDLPEAAT